MKWLGPYLAVADARLQSLQIAERLGTRGEALTQYVEFEQCGHIPMEERPAAFIKALDDFLIEAPFGATNKAGHQMSEGDLEFVADTLPVARVGTSVAAVQAVK